MKKLILITLMVVASVISRAQTKPIRIIFDVTSNDTLTHQTAIRHATEEAKAHPEGQFEIVIYSGAMNMVVAGKSTVSPGLTQLLSYKNASVKVCEFTMKRHNVDKSQLVPGVATVKDGIVEIYEKQGEGWGYIKEAR